MQVRKSQQQFEEKFSLTTVCLSWAVFLDLPAPWEAIPAVKQALKVPHQHSKTLFYLTHRFLSSILTRKLNLLEFAASAPVPNKFFEPFQPSTIQDSPALPCTKHSYEQSTLEAILL